MIATIVDTDALWQTIVGAFIAGIGTTIMFSVAVLGATRFVEASREGRGLQAALFGGLAVAGLLAVAGAVVVAIIVMTTK
jgi:hypothetical protein